MMSISAIGGADLPNNVPELQRQLTKDETTLLDDVKAKANEKTIVLDQNRVTLDASELAQAESQQAQSAQSAAKSSLDSYL
jgi:hypothetical protein